MMSGRSSRFPFTATQWQELEHQALIFKYMVSGIPIPPDLLFTLKRSSSSSPCSSFDSPVLSSKLFPSQSPHVGWSCFQLGLGRKIDPEPGRCRRTDGKKWRCSKEAYPDSKYCERHMHRGKNRSRKPVEVAATATNATSTLSIINNKKSSSPTLANHSSPYTHTSLSLLSSATADDHHDHHIHQSHYPHPPSHYNHHHLLSSSHPSATARHHPPDSTSLLLDSAGYCSLTTADFRSRSIYGWKEDGDHEHAFFSETSGSMRNTSDDPWRLSPLGGINSSSSSSCSSSSSKQRGSSGLQTDYSYLQLQSNLSEESYSTKQSKQDGGNNNSSSNNNNNNNNNSLVDGKAQTMIKFDRGGGEEAEKTTVHRFFDEWPPKNKESTSWLDLDTSTRLSISIPNSSSLDFPIFNSRSHHQHHQH